MYTKVLSLRNYRTFIDETFGTILKRITHFLHSRVIVIDIDGNGYWHPHKDIFTLRIILNSKKPKGPSTISLVSLVHLSSLNLFVGELLKNSLL